MSARLDLERCSRCGRCLEVCPGGLLRAGPDGRPTLAEPERCWSCAACLKECPNQALALSLPPSLGGRGTLLTAARRPDGLEWTAHFPDGRTKTLRS
ncbi:MAG: ferredoxin family protein [Deltaproteobacteria bacterium]|jgi:adenylylsulfate reductase subunit B|nr:ferredoxin family protein [Deltaproteobacteria bacterium]